MPLETEVALSFSPKKQLAILGHLLCDEKFFLFAKDIVKPNWFTDTIVGKAYKAKQERYEKYRRHIGAQEIVDSPEIVAEGQVLPERGRTALSPLVHEGVVARVRVERLQGEAAVVPARGIIGSHGRVASQTRHEPIGRARQRAQQRGGGRRRTFPPG